MTSLICAAFVLTTNKIIGLAMLAAVLVAFVIIACIKPKAEDSVAEVAQPVEETSAPAKDIVQEVQPVQEPVEQVSEQLAEVVAPVEEQPVADVVEEVAEEQPVEAKAIVEEAVVVAEEKTEDVAQQEVQPVEEAQAEVAATVVEDQPVDQFSKFKSIPVGKKRTFAEKVVEADEENQAIYNLLKNELMSYKKVSNRLTKVIDIFKYKGTYLAKVGLVGKTIKLHLALEPNDYAVSKYHHQDLGEKKKYEFVPLALKVKSPRSQKYALELIAGVMEKAGLQKNPKYQEIDYVSAMKEVQQVDDAQ